MTALYDLELREPTVRDALIESAYQSDVHERFVTRPLESLPQEVIKSQDAIPQPVVSNHITDSERESHETFCLGQETTNPRTCRICYQEWVKSFEPAVAKQSAVTEPEERKIINGRDVWSGTYDEHLKKHLSAPRKSCPHCQELNILSNQKKGVLTLKGGGRVYLGSYASKDEADLAHDLAFLLHPYATGKLYYPDGTPEHLKPVEAAVEIKVRQKLRDAGWSA